jgi:hypothetical protein
MAQKTIELGTAPDGMDGDDARTAFQKTNDNFTELYQGVGGAQPANPKLSAIAASVWAANQLLIATGVDTIGALATGTAGRALVAAESAAQGRSAIAAQLSHVNLTALSAIVSDVDRLPIFTNNAGAMTFLQAGAAGKQLVGTTTLDSVRTLIEVTRPLCTTVSETRNFNTILAQGWWPELVANSAPNSPNSAFGLSSTNPAAPYWYVHNNIYNNSDTHILQTAYPYATDDTNRAAPVWRIRYGGVWGNWRRALTMGDVVAGTYDATVGKLVTTGTASGDGWMGLGATSTPAVANLNTITSTSFYTFNETAVGRPDLFGYGNVLTIIRAANEATQIAYSVVSPNTMTRRKLNSIWSAWTDATPIGIGQSWQDMTPQRAAGVNYVNSTGRPIQVSVAAQAGQVGNYFVLYVNGVPAAYSGSGFSTGAIIACQPVIVPPDATYSLATSSGVAMVGPSWKELR